MNKIFVYGSLRRGGGLSGYLNNSVFVGEFKTKPEYNLLSLGPFPALVAGGETAVLGEVYDVSDQMIFLLDQVEGHPDLYKRTPIELEDGTKVEAYLFEEFPIGCKVIESGDWIKFERQIK